jgi:TP901 family phage tail tape measure protein
VAQANFDAEIRLDISPFIASMQKAQSEVAKLSGQIDALNKKTITVKTNVVSPTSSSTAAGSGSNARMAASRQELALQKELDAKAKESAKQKQQATAALRKESEQAASQQQRVAQQTERNLARERYALYDVAAAYTIIATAAGAAVRSLATTAIDYERSFSDVQRTTENFFTSAQIGAAANAAKEELKSLASEIPVAFGQITEIATIGNQLGIAQGAIGSFSETVAKFSAATGVSVESTAMSFGRIGELLNVPASEFENLGSSIAFAGVNAVATEEQILSVTKEIATTAKMAKFTTPEVVGLSTALSSLGIAPEAARGSIIRTFAGINKAISENGERLQQYASIAGMSAEQFASTWQTNGQIAFGSLLKGLQELSDQGQNLDTVLRGIGMVNVRDIQAVQKLGDNYGVYASSIEDANKGFREGAFLGDAYAIIQDTVAAKLALVSNNISNLLDTLGQTAVGDFFKGVLDVVNDLLVRLNQFAKSPVGQAVGLLAVSLGTIVTVIAAINAASALAQASLRAFATAQVALIGPTEAAAASVAKVNGQLIATGTAGKTAALGLQKGKIAMSAVSTVFNAVKVLAAITIITTALEKLGEAFTSSAQKAENLLGSFGGLQDALSADYADALAQYGTEAAIGLAIANEEIKGQTIELESNNQAVRDAAQLQEGLAVIAGTGLTNGIASATDEVRAQNVVLGENFNAWVASSIASSDAFKNFAMDRSAMNALKEIGFNLQDAINVAADGGDVVDYVRQLGAEAERAGKLSSGAAIELAKLLALSNVPFYANPLGNLANVIEGSVAQTSILGALLPKVGDDIKTAAEEAEELEQGFKGAARALRTVVDYANDLRTVFSRAMEITFGQQQALDKIASGWANVADKADRAAKAIADANAEIKELTADRSVLEYQLTVAERYGDEQRAAIIRAKLAKIDNNIIKQTEKKTEAEAELSKSTQGNSASAIENRKVLTDMVGDYASLIEMYSKTGMKGKELKARITELRKEFRQQALEAGYSREEIAPYVKMFGEFKTIVDKTPRNVDVEFKANVSAANQALKEFIAKINSSSGTVTIRTNNVVTTTTAPSPTAPAASTAIPKGTASNPYTTGIMPGMSVPAGTKTLTAPMGSFVQMPQGLYMHGLSLSGSNVILRYGPEKNNINGKAVKISGNTVRLQTSLIGNINELTKFAKGGYVSGKGTGTSDSIPAMLSNGEFVIKASAVGTYGIDFLNALNQQKVGSFTSNSSSVNNMSGSTVAHLSPEDRALLRAVIDRPVNLYTENAKIASSANAGNVVLAQRGTN